MTDYPDGEAEEQEEPWTKAEARSESLLNKPTTTPLRRLNDMTKKDNAALSKTPHYAVHCIH